MHTPDHTSPKHDTSCHVWLYRLDWLSLPGCVCVCQSIKRTCRPQSLLLLAYNTRVSLEAILLFSSHHHHLPADLYRDSLLLPATQSFCIFPPATTIILHRDCYAFFLDYGRWCSSLPLLVDALHGSIHPNQSSLFSRGRRDSGCTQLAPNTSETICWQHAESGKSSTIVIYPYIITVSYWWIYYSQ